jgi:predicted transcriptional regulator
MTNTQKKKKRLYATLKTVNRLIHKGVIKHRKLKDISDVVEMYSKNEYPLPVKNLVEWCNEIKSIADKVFAEEKQREKEQIEELKIERMLCRNKELGYAQARELNDFNPHRIVKGSFGSNSR